MEENQVPNNQPPQTGAPPSTPTPPAAPVMGSPESSGPPKKKSKAPMIVIIVVAVLIIGGGVYAALNGYIPGLGPSTPTIEEIADTLDQINSAHTETSITVTVEERDPNIEGIKSSDFNSTSSLMEAAFIKSDSKSEQVAQLNQAELFGDQAPVDTAPIQDKFPNDTSAGFVAPDPDIAADPYMSILSPSLNSEFKMTSSSDWQKTDTLTESSSDFEVSMKSDGISATAAGSIISTKDAIYFNLKTLPVLFFDLSAIKNVWIEIPTQGGNPFEDEEVAVFKQESTSSLDPANYDPEQINDEMTAWMTESLRQGAVTIDSSENVTENDRKVTKLHTSFHPDKLISAYNTVYENRTTLLSGIENYIIFSDDLNESINQPEVLMLLTEYTKNLNIIATLDRKTKQPIGFEADMVLAIDDVAMYKDIQWRLKFSTMMTKINEPVEITPPGETKKLYEILSVAFGRTDEEIVLSQQLEIINGLKTALSQYQRDNNEYPESLSDLIGTDVVYRGKVFQIPNDRYTNQPFDYSRTDDDYELKYRINLPKEGILAESYSQSYIDGVNTATSKFVSKEAAAIKDTDKDGLTDLEEEELGTSKYSRDTDGDGYTDKEEVDSGNDPLNLPVPQE